MEARSDQENRLLDYVERLERHADGRVALHVQYSKLKPSNRQDRQLRMAATAFTAAIKRFDAYLFNLANSDQVLIAKGATYADLEPEMNKIRGLFAGDPFFADPTGEDLFGWYDLSEDYNVFLSVARSLKQAAEQKRQVQMKKAANGQAPKPRKNLVPLQPDNLGRLVEQLASMDISSLLRRQPVCAVTDNGGVRPVFNELFVSIADLRNTVMPTVDLAASAPLFSYLTQYLDKRILRAMPDMEASIPLSTSININIETVLSPQFLEFDQRLRAVTKKTIVLEVQPAETKKAIQRKLRAKKFIRFKADSSVVPVTNTEAREYFDNNRLKFGDLPFENFKENIKAYLSRQQVEQRLRDWFEVLQNKYKVKNALSEI